MSAARVIGIVLFLVLLPACGSTDPPPPREADRALDDAIQAPLDRARAVEDDLKQARRAQDEKLEDGGG
jgi:hypothetical protein